MKDESYPQISIVVACRNEKDSIGKFLESLLAQELAGIGWEAIIADGMSDDGTRAILEEWRRRDTRLRMVDNEGRIVSTGLNKAIAAARGRVILRMDAHTRYAPDYCLQCFETLQHTGAQNVGGPANTEAQGTLARAIAAAYHSPFSTGPNRFHDETYEGWVDTVPYGCWLRSTFDEVGFFDPELIRNQDDEHNLRILRAGGKIWQTPRIVSWYSPRAKLWGLFGQYFQYGFWRVATIRKHRIRGSWRRLVPVAFVGANAILLVAMAIAMFRGATHWFSFFVAAWLGVLGAYTAATLLASVAAARRHGWDTLPHLPMVFAVYHFSYGLGFVAGLLRFSFGRPQPLLGADSRFARLTR